jgi:hypothetical protein
MARRPIKTKFECTNPHKYVGDPNNIICRSSWERFFASNLDVNPAVERWASEEIAIKYISPRDGLEHRYFCDFLVKFTSGKVVLIEIKPYSQAIPPVKPSKNSNKAIARYHEDSMTFLVNQAKWHAARHFCKMNGFEFQVMTENELRKLGCPV